MRRISARPEFHALAIAVMAILPLFISLPAAAQIDAFLPYQNTVPKTGALPIDGVWTISTLGKRIRIEQGRAYAVDPWVHLFTMQIKPDMVVMQNFKRTEAGEYSADDLPLAGPATLSLTPNGDLNVNVKGALGPAQYALVRVEPDSPQNLNAELAAATGTVAPAMFRTAGDGESSGTGSSGGVTPQAPANPPPRPAPARAPLPPAGQLPADCEPIGVDPDSGMTVCA